MEKQVYLKSVEKITGTKMVPCESSNIEGFGYNHKNQELLVAFKGAKVYKYYEVPEDIFKGLIDAESKGKYLNQNVKNSFKYQGYELV